jgi:hypothetical protein
MLGPLGVMNGVATTHNHARRDGRGGKFVFHIKRERLQAGSEEVVSSIARRALSLIADAGHLALPEPASPAGGQAASSAVATVERPPAGPPASQLFQPELQRVVCSAIDLGHGAANSCIRPGSGGDRPDATGLHGASATSCEDASRQCTANEARASSRQAESGAVSRQPTAAAEPGPANRTSSGLGPSPKAAALLTRLKAFMDEHILPAGALDSAIGDLKHWCQPVVLCFLPVRNCNWMEVN